MRKCRSGSSCASNNPASRIVKTSSVSWITSMRMRSGFERLFYSHRKKALNFVKGDDVARANAERAIRLENIGGDDAPLRGRYICAGQQIISAPGQSIGAI